MPNRDEQQHDSPRDVPPVGRPRGAVWRSLQADGVVWEGQVLLVGDDVDLASRMIVTHRRVVFVRGGELALDMPRGWLRPEPELRRDGVLDLFVTMPDANLFDEPLRVPIRMREGHAAAGHIIAMLAPSGVRRISPDALSGIERAREATTPPRFGGFWDDIENDSLLPTNGLVGAVDDFDPVPEARGLSDEQPALAPLEPPDRVVRAPSSSQRQHASAFPITGLLPRDQRRSHWRLLFRLGALFVLLGTAAALGAGKLDIQVPGLAHEPILVAPTATVPVIGSPSEVPDTALSPEEQSAVAIGVGGPAAELTSEDQTATAISVAAVTATPTPVGVGASPAPVVAPTEAMIPTPAAIATPPPAPTVTTPAPTAAPILATPSTPAPATEAETPASAVATPEPTSLTQAAAVSADQPPAQEIVVGPLRIAFPTALRGESLPRYALPPGSGDWVLLVARMTNQSNAAATLAMSNIRLFDRGTGTILNLDTGTDVIATLAGFDPAWTNEDVVPVGPGESAETLLLYLLPPGSSDDLALIVDQASIDLAPMLALGEAEPAATPELIEASVTEVLDGSRITVDIGGLQETVRYLGFQAPAAGACFSSEATAANRDLVEGQRVWLERQQTDRGDDGVLLRDVWITGQNGNRALVAARLLEAGAGTPAPAAPDTRYQAWLEASAALARFNGAGLWGACPDASASAALIPNDTPQFAFMSATWRNRLSFGR